MYSASNYIFNLHALPPFITALAILLLGSIVVIREKASRESLFYLCYTLAASAWMFCASAALSMSSEEMVYRWMIYANAGVTILPAALYHFTVVVMKTDNSHRLSIRFAWAISTVFLALTLFTDILFDGLNHYSWGIFLRFRWPSFLFMIYFLVLSVMTLRVYWVEYRRSDRDTTQHRRAKAFLIAFSIGYLGSLDFLPAIGIPYYPLSYVPMICMLVLVSRTIWRHRLVDITPAFAAREIIDTMNDALIVVDPDGIVRLVNPATCILFNCREQGMLGKRPGAGLGGDPAFAEALEAAIVSGTAGSHEVEYRQGDGPRRTLSVTVTVMRDPLGGLLAAVCVVSDITDRKRGEEERERLIAQLQVANEKLKEIDTMKSDFISIVSHELRTPLSNIKAFVELVVMKPGMPEQRKAKIMNIVNVEVDRLALLISDLLDLSRIESGAMMWRTASLSIEDMIQDTITNMMPLIEDRGLLLTTSFKSPLAPLSGDHDRLMQVMTNLLSNSAKFTPQGGAIHVAVRQESNPRDQIVIEVSDTGTGIPAGDLDLIFQKFHRSGAPISSSVDGTGLGLSIARQIVEHHGGRIWAESTPGKGSVFTVILPLRT